MRGKKLIGIIVALLLFAAGNNAIAAPLILNGSFESIPTPAISVNSWAYVTSIPNWAVGTSNNAIFNGNIGGGWPGPKDGQQLIDIGNLPSYSISQSFQVTQGGAYNLSWYDSDYLYELANTAPYIVSIINTNSNASVYNGTLRVVNPGVWNFESILLDLAVGNYNLSFTPTGAQGYVDTLLDDITLTPTSPLPPETVPEPSTLILVGIGISATCLLRRKLHK
jgi:hypothetical protein